MLDLYNLSNLRDLEQMEPILNFQVAAEGLELLTLLHTPYYALRHHKAIINDESHPFLVLFLLIISNFFTKIILKNS
jgi:hypothetical protein